MDPEIVVVGSINFDIVVTTDRYPRRGETVTGRALRYQGGGKGANQAVASVKMGKQTSLIGMVGDDAYGRQILDTLCRFGIDTSGIYLHPEAPTGVTLVMIDGQAENTMLVVRGANDHLNEQHVDRYAGLIAGAKVLLVQMEVPEEAVIRAMDIAKANGVFVILDPAPADGITIRPVQLADVITPNRQETKILTGIDVTDPISALDAARYLHDLGVRRSIIKMGEQGALVWDDGEWSHLEAVPAVPVDTLAAGDCFAGALAAALMDGHSLMEAARFAVVAGALKVTRHGTYEGIPSIEEIRAFARERRVPICYNA